MPSRGFSGLPSRGFSECRVGDFRSAGSGISRRHVCWNSKRCVQVIEVETGDFRYESNHFDREVKLGIPE